MRTHFFRERRSAPVTQSPKCVSSPICAAWHASIGLGSVRGRFAVICSPSCRRLARAHRKVEASMLENEIEDWALDTSRDPAGAVDDSVSTFNDFANAAPTSCRLGGVSRAELRWRLHAQSAEAFDPRQRNFREIGNWSDLVDGRFIE